MPSNGQLAPTDGVHRWLILTIGLAAQAASCIFLYGIPMLVPELRRTEHLSLAAAGWVVAAPTLGVLCTLIAWGAAADRFGERNVMALGLALAGALLLGAAATGDVIGRSVLLGLAGAAGASVSPASGKVVLGWFSPRERGTAMGARQTAQPLGVGIAALVLPPVAASAGIGWALTVPAFACLAVAALVMAAVVDPPRSAAAPGLRLGTPYLAPALWRLHGASTLLVIPQFTLSAFSLEYLVSQRHWGASAAGSLLFGFQVLGAAGRVATGRWSDRAGSRLGPMRLVALAATLTMLGVALGDSTGSVLVVAALGLGAVITVADNGLGFTAVAEFAGLAWAGRALGAQNTAQNIGASLTPPLLGALIGAAGYGVGFGVAAMFPLLAIGVTPFAAEASRRSPVAGQAPSEA
ncbi:MAG: MFS transporter [Actinomycetota bacterium]|nr:MFS transporter [Actinomycetota bacterium]